MPSLRDVKRRIRSVENTQQIAKAMEMVAAARLRRYQEKLLFARQVETKIQEALAAALPENFSDPLTQEAVEEGAEVVLFSSDRGLCGSFNGNIVRRFWQEVEGQNIQQAIFIGKKAYQMIRFTGRFQGNIERLSLPLRPQASDIQALFEKLRARFLEHRRAIYLLYTYPHSTSRSELRLEPLFPAQLPERKEARFLYEPAVEKLAGFLLTFYLQLRFQSTLLSSLVAEYAARMLAMQAAGKNAGELSEQLTLSFNKARQAMITKELLEVVGGAEALKKD